MKPKNDDIHSNFDLEARFFSDGERKKFESLSLVEIMNEVFHNLQKLEENLDTLLSREK